MWGRSGSRQEQSERDHFSICRHFFGDELIDRDQPNFAASAAAMLVEQRVKHRSLKLDLFQKRAPHVRGVAAIALPIQTDVDGCPAAHMLGRIPGQIRIRAAKPADRLLVGRGGDLQKIVARSAEDDSAGEARLAHPEADRRIFEFVGARLAGRFRQVLDGAQQSHVRFLKIGEDHPGAMDWSRIRCGLDLRLLSKHVALPRAVGPFVGQEG